MSSTHISIDALSAPPQWRELDSRESNGVSVSLLWSKAENRIKVAVTDGQLDQSFELHVAGPEALASFHHPFAYAASRGLYFGAATRTSHDLQPLS